MEIFFPTSLVNQSGVSLHLLILVYTAGPSHHNFHLFNPSNATYFRGPCDLHDRLHCFTLAPTLICQSSGYRILPT